MISMNRLFTACLSLFLLLLVPSIALSEVKPTMDLYAAFALRGVGDESNLFTFLKQRAELNPKLQLYGTDYLDGYVSQEKLLPSFNKVDFISPHVYDKSFADAYQKRFNAAPVLSASTSYDATSILIQALRAGNRTPETIRAYLLKNEFDSATFGKTKFNDFGGVQSSEFVIKKVKDKQISETPIS